MSKLNRLPGCDRLPFLCGAVLLITTLTMAQYALDANLRVGSGGYNAHRRPQVTMKRSPYAVSTQGDIVYNRGVAFGSPEVYSRRNNVYLQNAGNPSRQPLRRSKPAPSGALTMHRAPYSANKSVTRSVNSYAATPGVKTVRRKPSSARSGSTIQRSSYWAGSAASQMQTPTLQLQRQSYKPTGS